MLRSVHANLGNLRPYAPVKTSATVLEGDGRV